MNKLLLVLLVVLSLSMAYAAPAEAKDKTAAKEDVSKKEKTTGEGETRDKGKTTHGEKTQEKKKKIPDEKKTKNVGWWTLAKKHSDAVFKVMPEIKKNFETIVEQKGLSPKERRSKLWALYTKNPAAYSAVVQTYYHIRRPHQRARKRSQ